MNVAVTLSLAFCTVMGPFFSTSYPPLVVSHAVPNAVHRTQMQRYSFLMARPKIVLSSVRI